MMGLVESAILWSWITTYVLIFLFVSIGVTAICKATVFGASDTSILFIFFFSFSMSSVCYAYLITVFFDKATSAAVMGALIFVGGYFPIYAVNDDTSTRNSKILCSLLSPVAMGTYTYLLLSNITQNINKHRPRNEHDRFLRVCENRCDVDKLE